VGEPWNARKDVKREGSSRGEKYCHLLSGQRWDRTRHVLVTYSKVMKKESVLCWEGKVRDPRDFSLAKKVKGGVVDLSGLGGDSGGGC